MEPHTDLEVIVVDNGSSDGSAEMVRREFSDRLLLPERENLGFAEACNRGIDASTGEWVAMLNNDTVAEPTWAQELVRVATVAPPECGMLQSLLLFRARPGVINSTGIELAYSGGGRDRDAGAPFVPGRVPEEIFCPTAGAAAYRRQMLDGVKLPEGYFDRRHFMYYEDMDLGWRARLAGWSALYVPSSVVLHRWHGSSDRHGRAWLAVMSKTNRIRTLLKNASIPFLVRTGPRTVKELAEIAWHGRVRGLRAVATAVRESVESRRRVAAMTVREREAVEARWRAARRP